MNIGKIERVALREVWRHEAHDFTQWLENNIDTLNAALDLNLVNIEREQAAGCFSVDLVGEDMNGHTVIIENQLEKSNHDHLGKLLTYLTLMEAKAAVWIVSDPRPEHTATLAWLNEFSTAEFYMVKVEAIKIGDSMPAPLFTLIVGPSAEAKEVGTVKKNIAERYQIRKRWWSQLITLSEQTNRLHSHLSPKEYNWIGTSSGYRGLNYNYTVTQDATSIELYIDRGPDHEDENKDIFNSFYAYKDAIEKSFGEALNWESLEGKRACKVQYHIRDGGYRSPEENWPDIQQKAIEAMARLEKTFKPYIRQLQT